MIKTISFRLFQLFTGLLMAAGSPSILYLSLFGNARQIRLVSRIWCRAVLFLLRIFCGLRHREIGRAHRPIGPAIYACNHQSYWEALAFNVLVPDIAIVLKASLTRIPIAGWFLRRAPMISVDRAQGTVALRKLLHEAREALANGRHVLIFPEATFQGPTARPRFKPGVLALYQACDCPVVPVAINSGLFWPGHKGIAQPGVITVSYLAPIEPGLSGDLFMVRLEGAIFTERDRLIGEALIPVTTTRDCR